jgi:hypothetical protein
MLAEMQGDRLSAARHLLAAAHMELVLAADFDACGETELAVRSRLGSASCFWRAGDSPTALRLIQDLLATYPDRAATILELQADLEQCKPLP